MRSMIEWLRIIGNPPSEWIAWARSVARRLYLSGDRTQKQLQLYDGTMIYIQFVDENAYILINGSSSAIAYLSGMQEIAAATDYGYAGQFYPARETTKGILFDWYQYGTITGYAWPPHNIDPATDDHRGLFILNWPVKTRPPLPDDIGYTLVPGLFTGKMRLVQQKIYANKLYNQFHSNCGIFIPSTDGVDALKQRWVIDIRQNGIYTYPIKFILESKKIIKSDEFASLSQDQQDRYDYLLRESYTIPVTLFDSYSDWVDDGKDLNKGFRITDESGLLSVYGKGAITPWLGNWAFSYTGHEAQIVLFSPKSYSGGELWNAQRFKLSITETDGIPTSGVINLVEEDYVWTTQFKPNALTKHQISAPIISPTAEFIYFWRPDTDEGGSWPSSHDAPLYVFYDTDNNEVVLRHKFSEQVNLPDDEVPFSNVYGVILDTPYSSPSYGNTAQGWDQHAYAYSGQSYHTDCFYSTKTFPSEQEETKTIDYDEVYSYGDLLSTYAVFVAYYGAQSVLVVSQHYNGLMVRSAGYDEYNSIYEHIGLPAFNRECFFHYRKSIQFVGGHDELYHHAEFSTGPILYPSGYRTSGGIKIPGSDFTPTGYGSAGAGTGGAYSTVSIPDNINEERKYYCVTSNPTVVNIDSPYNDELYFGYYEQLYESQIGAFSGIGFVLPWPRTDVNSESIEFKLDKFVLNGQPQEYPYMDAQGYIASSLSYPLLVFIGDESTAQKPINIDADIEAIKY